MRRRRATVQWRHLVNWREALVVANGPNIFQMLLVVERNRIYMSSVIRISYRENHLKANVSMLLNMNLLYSQLYIFHSVSVAWISAA